MKDKKEKFTLFREGKVKVFFTITKIHQESKYMYYLSPKIPNLFLEIGWINVVLGQTA